VRCAARAYTVSVLMPPEVATWLTMVRKASRGKQYASPAFMHAISKGKRPALGCMARLCDRTRAEARAQRREAGDCAAACARAPPQRAPHNARSGGGALEHTNGEALAGSERAELRAALVDLGRSHAPAAGGGDEDAVCRSTRFDDVLSPLV
jgi:hypothetical protein